MVTHKYGIGMPKFGAGGLAKKQYQFRTKATYSSSDLNDLDLEN